MTWRNNTVMTWQVSFSFPPPAASSASPPLPEMALQAPRPTVTIKIPDSPTPTERVKLLKRKLHAKENELSHLWGKHNTMLQRVQRLIDSIKPTGEADEDDDDDEDEDEPENKQRSIKRKLIHLLECDDGDTSEDDYSDSEDEDTEARMERKGMRHVERHEARKDLEYSSSSE
jgi:hypothetical protein